MPNPRVIREKALLSLFAYAAQKNNESGESTFDLALEPELERIDKLALKALKHQLPSLVKWSTEFCSIAPTITPMLKAYEFKSEARALASASKAVNALNGDYAKLGKLSDGQEIEQFCHKATTLNDSLRKLKTQLLGIAFTAPEFPKLQSSCQKLIEVTTRVDLIANPLDHPEETTISALYKSTKECSELRSEAQALVTGVIDNLEALDLAISENLNHFSMDQIGRVELCLLRLATYEITVQKTAKGIVINEALELSRRFTTEDAVPLINGVLDKV